MRLLLVRHAESAANAAGMLSTVVPGPQLTPLGREQAEALATTLAGTPVAAAYASTMLRAQCTAYPLARSLQSSVRIVEGIQEVEAGDDEGAATASAMLGYRSAIDRWVAGDLLARIPGGRTGAEVLERYDAAIAAIRARHAADATVVVVSHSVAMRVWVGSRASNLTTVSAASAPLANCGSIDLRLDERGGSTVERWQNAYPPFDADGTGSDPFDGGHRSR